MEIINFLQTFASPTLDSIALAITNLGSQQFYIASFVILYLAYDSRVGRRIGIILLLGFYINFHLKGIVDTERPFLVDESLVRSEAARETAIGGAFPSGHAQGAMTFWGLLAAYGRRTWLTIISVAFIILISVSRTYLGVHFPIDIVGGLAIGLAMVVLGLVLSNAFSNVHLDRTLVVIFGIAVPLALHIFLPTPDSETLLGGLAAFITAPALLKHHVPKDTLRKILIIVLGIGLVFGALVGSSLLLPEELKRNFIVGFVRYLLIGWVGTLLAPWLAKLIRLAPKQATSEQ